MSVSQWLLLCACGDGSRLAHRNAAGFSAVSEAWEEGTWDMDSLFKRPSLCTRVSADESWQGRSGRAQKASGRTLGEAWSSRPGLGMNWGTWRPPRVQNYFWLSLIQSLEGIPGPGPDGGLGTLMGNGLGLLAPSSLVLGTSLGEEGGWFKTKGFQVDGGRDLSCKDREVYAGKLSLGSWKPIIYLHLALPLTDNLGYILSPLWTSMSLPVKRGICLDRWSSSFYSTHRFQDLIYSTWLAYIN